jgi:hypothetical protein
MYTVVAGNKTKNYHRVGAAIKYARKLAKENVGQKFAVTNAHNREIFSVVIGEKSSLPIVDYRINDDWRN